MSLKKKIILIISFGVLLSLVIGFLSVYLIINNKFNLIETSVSENKSEERTTLINSGFETINTLSSDWGGWDDTYNYINDRNTQFIESNLYNEEYSVLKVNVILLADKNKDTVYFGSRDYVHNSSFKNDSEVKVLLEKLLDSIEFKDVHEEIYGYLGSENIYYFSAHQILPSIISDTSTSNGIIIFLKQIDFSDPTNFGITIPQHSSLQILPYTNINSLNLNPTQVNLLINNGEVINETNESKISISSLIKDYYGEPLFILKIDSEKTYTTEAINTLSSVYLALTIILGFLGIAFYISIEKNLFNKLSIITTFLEQTKDPLNTKERLNENLGKDLNYLKTTVNALLDKVQEQKTELDNVNKEFKTQNSDLIIRQKELDERNRELNSLNQTMVGREMRMIELKNELDELSKKVIEIDKKDNTINN